MTHGRNDNFRVVGNLFVGFFIKVFAIAAAANVIFNISVFGTVGICFFDFGNVVSMSEWSVDLIRANGTKLGSGLSCIFSGYMDLHGAMSTAIRCYTYP